MAKFPIIHQPRAVAPACRLVFLVAVALLAFAAGAETPSKPAAPSKPGDIGVLLLPATDTEPWAANVLLQRQDVVRRRLQHDFLARGFKLYGEALAQSTAATAPRVDLSNPAQRTAENLDELAKRTGANWIVSLDVQQVADDPAKTDEAHFHCFCRVQFKVWDAVQRKWRVDGTFTGHDRGDRQSPIWLFMEAIDEATRVALASVLDPYPVVVDMGDVGPVADYLAGQTGPFVPQPGRPLGGASVPP